jgi:hypothetical protein
VFLIIYIKRSKKMTNKRSLDTLGRKREMHEKRRDKYRDRGTSGTAQSMKEYKKIEDAYGKDVGLKMRYGKDAPKSRSFGIDPTVAKDMNLSGKLDMSKRELQEKFGKKAGKMIKKKSYAAGKMVKKKMMSKGKLVGGQAKLDKNSDGKISGEDFKLMYGGGMTKKKMMAGGGVKKKMMAKGGATGGKKKAKVRGAGIARKGVRPAKMR